MSRTSPSTPTVGCTCLEAVGENPECALHGVSTRWALENTSPEDWQEQVINLHRFADDATIFLGSQGLWAAFCDERVRARRTAPPSGDVA